MYRKKIRTKKTYSFAYISAFHQTDEALLAHMREAALAAATPQAAQNITQVLLEG